MAVKRADREFGQHKVTGRRKTVAIVLGLMAFGLAAFTVAEEAPVPLHVVAAAAKHVEATASGATTVSDERLPVQAQVSSGAVDEIGMPASTPRPCRLDQGIVNDCTFE